MKISNANQCFFQVGIFMISIRRSYHKRNRENRFIHHTKTPPQIILPYQILPSMWKTSYSLSNRCHNFADLKIFIDQLTCWNSVQFLQILILVCFLNQLQVGDRKRTPCCVRDWKKLFDPTDYKKCTFLGFGVHVLLVQKSLKIPQGVNL